MRFSVYQESHIGGRGMNQDRMGYSYTRDALLLVLADGMGGHPRGEVAATIALQTISALFQQQADPYVKGPARFLEDACHAAHREIHRHAAAHGMETPRTTIVACIVQHNTATWAHCGDSRLYLLRGGSILARTRDHSHIEKMIDAGRVPESARHTHPDRNKLYNCLGADTAPRVELSRQAHLVSGDVMLLCSDGLWAVLPEQELVAALSTSPVERAMPGLLRHALRVAGAGSDNVTGLAIAWQEPDDTGGDARADARASAGSTMVFTESLASGGLGTTIAPADPFDEAEIDRAIAEIRLAIEKSSQLLK
ncbi:PP2C family protein-serine/threonine phosphatase [Pseudoduganella umbonata]|uniref:Protein phosphatase n=1 Tax=Pseudoduganella umbonata TaxID=864828 RepID=A0A4P8HQG6_9BURK|nr:protein phosphatase 2C domain-containing protein [Pseudoduganella umbonata]MBB3224220.1 protein phosphatase [Pseudoduganella umbonata]QCP11396.1 serine/threonine-protein phosphatase [Pseudoduganella umbonata]